MWQSRASLLVDIPRGAYVLKQLETGIDGIPQQSLFDKDGFNYHRSSGDVTSAELIITGMDK